MKKIVVLFLVLCLFFALSINTFAITESADESIYSSIYSSLSDETKQAVSDFGINGIDYNSLIDLSPGDFFSFFIKTLEGKISGSLKSFIVVLSVIMLISGFSSYFPDDNKRKEMFFSVSAIIIALTILNSVFPLIKAAMSVIDMTSKFMLTLLPILAGLIASCRNPVMAVSMNSIAIYIANLISLFANKYLLPFMSVYFVVCSAGCISRELSLSHLALFIKNTVIKVLAVLSSFYISFLSIKGIFTNSVDTVTSKGAKLIISTAIPVIGSSLSEAYFAVSGSLVLLKSSVGITGIILIALMNVPIIVELLLWSSFLSLNSIIGKMFNISVVSDFLEQLSCVVKTLNIILIFCATLFIISIGLMISIRSTV